MVSAGNVDGAVSQAHDVFVYVTVGLSEFPRWNIKPLLLAYEAAEPRITSHKFLSLRPVL
jgi:hypothetical protein